MVLAESSLSSTSPVSSPSMGPVCKLIPYIFFSRNYALLFISKCCESPTVNRMIELGFPLFVEHPTLLRLPHGRPVVSSQTPLPSNGKFILSLYRFWTFSRLGCLADSYRAAVDRGMVGRRVHQAVKRPTFQGMLREEVRWLYNNRRHRLCPSGCVDVGWPASLACVRGWVRQRCL